MHDHRASPHPRTRPHRIAAAGLAGLAIALLASACAVGPDFVRPDMAVPQRFATAPGAPSAGMQAARAPSAAMPAADAEFWRRFGDPLLDRLVDDALEANHDLRIALARYDRANALLRGAGFDRFPTVTAQATGSDIRSSAGQMPGATRAERDGTSREAGIVASWELDLFGRVRRGVEASRAGAAASSADFAAMQVAIVGEVADSYLELRGLQERLRVATANAANQRETLRLVDARFAAGRGTEFDTSRASAQLETTEARLPALDAAIATTMHRLAVLTGRAPGALTDMLATPAGLPMVPERPAAGTPGDVLRRRPDVIAAEQRLHAATARIGVATADLFPRFTLGGLIGSQALEGGDLFERDSETRLLALGIDWSFLDIGRVRARIAAADADAAGELARYEQTVLRALEDTEDALARNHHAQDEDAHLQRAAADSARAAELARIRFEAGAADLFEVLDAERTRLQAQDAFAAARTRTATSAVALYRAMAGGWPAKLPAERVVAARIAPAHITPTTPPKDQ